MNSKNLSYSESKKLCGNINRIQEFICAGVKDEVIVAHFAGEGVPISVEWARLVRNELDMMTAKAVSKESTAVTIAAIKRDRAIHGNVIDIKRAA